MPNTSTTSAANAAATVTLTGVGQLRQVIQRLDSWTSAGTSQITISDGGTTVWLSPSAWVTTSLTSFAPLTYLRGAPGNTVTITASAAGAGNTVTLNVQHDIA